MSARRAVQDLNRALLDVMSADERLYLIGEDISDPYGGAFKVTRGLSSRHPDRVLSTPISEAAIVGVAGGLALQGNRVIAEIMFGDFLGLCFDQLVNFAAKSVTMYGRRIAMPIVIRCPVGGQRGYGPTHSQNLQKHFIGVPNLALFEMSLCHGNRGAIERMLGLAQPCLFFEDKGLYPMGMHEDGVIDELFRFDFLDQAGNCARIFPGEAGRPDCVVLAPGGLVPRALPAIRRALLEQDLLCHLVVPSQLYPIDLEPVLPLVSEAGHACVLEDGVAGGTWGTQIAGMLYERAWGRLRAPVTLVHPGCEVIPAARHLEQRFAVTSDKIYAALSEMAHA